MLTRPRTDVAHLRYIPLMLPPLLPAAADLKLPLLLPLLLWIALIDDVSMAEAVFEPSPPAPVPANPAPPLPLRGGVEGLRLELQLSGLEPQVVEAVSTMLSTGVGSCVGGSSTEICRHDCRCYSYAKEKMVTCCGQRELTTCLR